MSLDKRDAIQILTSVMRVAALALLVWLLTRSASLADGVTPTTEWINIYSTSSTLGGQPLPVGSSVAVRDAQGNRCGEFQVTTEGWYGLMACYRDDPMTPRDEGAAVGDALRFTVNRRSAAATAISLNGAAVPPSTPVTWTANGDLWEVDLQGLDRSQVIGGYSLPAGRLGLSWSRAALLIAALGLAIAAIAAVARHGRRHRDEPAPLP